MGTIRVVLRKGRKLKDGRYPLAIRLTHNKKLKYIFTPYSALEKEWNGKYPIFLNSQHPNQNELNQYFIQLYSNAINHQLLLEKSGRPFTVKELHQSITRKESTKTFFGLSNEIIDKLIEAGRIGTAEANKTAINAVKRFSNGKDFQFEEINFQWLKDFETYHYSRGNTSVSLGIYLRVVRLVFNTAIKQNIVSESHYPFGRNRYTIPTGPARKRAISKEDIIKIEKLELQKDSYLWHTKNYFLFSFYTMGMNWIDMAHLKMKNIVDGRIEYIRLKTKRKTAKAFSVKINNKIQGILSHYTKGKGKEQYIFPIIRRTQSPTNIREDIKNRLKRYNQNLERIRKLCGIEQKLTSYVSRHSWATIAKKSGVNISLISDALGHHDPHITQTYLDSFGNDAIDEVNEQIIF